MQENPKILPIVGKAVTYLGLSGHGVIKILERTVRVPEAHEVRIEVKAAGVNPTDILSRSPGYGKPDEHFVPGMDAAGIVESVGSGVTRLHVGQLVMAAVLPRRPDGGAQAQYIVVPAASVVPIPEGTSLIEASTLPMNGLTALGALDLAALKECQTFAVSGGAGLLAHYAIAVVKRRGLIVIADAKPEEVNLVKSYGADVVVGRGPGFAEAVRREVPEVVDALLDTALLGEKSFGWAGDINERQIEIKPV